MITALVVDDELNSRENLKILLEDFCEGIRVAGTAASVAEAQKLIEEHNPNVVFLDIQMSGETGFDLLEKYKEINFEVLFVTAYSDYALKAIKFSAVDYLLKPIDIDELQVAVEKVKKRVKKNKFFPENIKVLMQNLTQTNEGMQKLAIPSTKKMLFLNIKDILYFEESGDGTIVHTRCGENHITHKALKEYEAILSGNNFYRIHKSYLVNLNEIKECLGKEEDSVIMNNDDSLLVSNKKREDLIKKIMK